MLAPLLREVTCRTGVATVALGAFAHALRMVQCPPVAACGVCARVALVPSPLA